MAFPRLGRYWLCFVLSLFLVTGCHHFWNPSYSSLAETKPPVMNLALLPEQSLVPLIQPGPWSDITGLIGYGDRLWFANSVAFTNHNSADIYSYAPDTGQTYYEQHLFSQSVGQPLVAGGLLYWPFEDPRFSADLGEYMVTNGTDWQWHILPTGEAFHIHTMMEHAGVLFAGTGAWAGRLQRSQDNGKTWEVVYEHPTPNQQVSRITELAVLNEQLYMGVTALQEDGIKLLRWQSEKARPVANWPKGKRVSDLTPYDGWLYGVNLNPDDSIVVWRTQDDQVERIAALEGYRIRALAAGPDALWAISVHEGGGFLWQSPDGVTWTVAHQFEGMRPSDVAIYRGDVYVGARGADDQGVLLGPETSGGTVSPLSQQPLPLQTAQLSPQELQSQLQQLDQVIAMGGSYANGNSQATLASALTPLALSGMAEVGEALSQRLDRSPPQATATLFDDVVSEPAKDVLQWYLLWAIGLNGHGQVPVELLSAPWTTPSNSREKYWQPAPAVAWAVAQMGQADDETIAALINRLSFAADPLWLKGDIVGALSRLTGEKFGYDEGAWQTWWTQRAIAATRTASSMNEPVVLKNWFDGQKASVEIAANADSLGPDYRAP
ncbi:MAG: hypothetical protein F6K42_03020 [Leptolyngbya sp. SIO1D8]|nr:hypothetical protein [Leptolyngbya sp. SIO1D8]